MSAMKEFTERQQTMEDLAVRKMASFWSHGDPAISFEKNVSIIRANRNLQEHYHGVMSIQCGRGVSYVFDLSIEGVREHYERMLDEAKRGLLASTGLLIGMFETHKDSGIEEHLAYFVTSARSSRSYYS